jgi:hypothetical protein
MLSIKGRYNGSIITLDNIPIMNECEVIVTFLDFPLGQKSETSLQSEKFVDDGSLAYLFRDYLDDDIREPIVNFGEAVGNEKW